MQTGKRWLITGVSSGFGKLLAEAALARGDRVVGTLRQPDQAEAFSALAPGRTRGLVLDVTDRPGIQTVVNEAVSTFDGLDILVNNAGYGLGGALEELTDDEIDHVIATNLFGPIFVTRAALPALRASRGRIINFSSMAGLVGLPGMAPYCAAKHAVEGLSEALNAEVSPFGVRVMVVAPGGFRTNFFKGSERTSSAPLAIYDGTPAGMTRDSLCKVGDLMPGDPVKAVAAILQAIDTDSPPLHLLLGSDALAGYRKKIEEMHDSIKEWESVTLSTDF